MIKGNETVMAMGNPCMHAGKDYILVFFSIIEACFTRIPSESLTKYLCSFFIYVRLHWSRSLCCKEKAILPVILWAAKVKLPPGSCHQISMQIKRLLCLLGRFILSSRNWFIIVQEEINTVGKGDLVSCILCHKNNIKLNI